jgi:hypothetical protein
LAILLTRILLTNLKPTPPFYQATRRLTSRYLSTRNSKSNNL